MDDSARRGNIHPQMDRTKMDSDSSTNVANSEDNTTVHSQSSDAAVIFFFRKFYFVMQQFFSTVVVQRDQKVLFVVLVFSVGFYARTHTQHAYSFNLVCSFYLGK